MVDAENLDEVDALLRYLDLPFDLNQWTRLHASHGTHTLTAYFNLLADDCYQALSWKEEETRWKLAREEATTDDQMEVMEEAKARRLRRTWASEYTADELLWLDNFYNRILATQNVSTPILEEYAHDLCEIELRIKKGLRAGADVKKDMDARDNIVKMGKFDATNSKSATGFESVGELMVYYGKKGWHPEWHQEPQDQADFVMKNTQTYLQRLVHGEGNLAEQVEQRREAYEISQRLEETGQDIFAVEDTDAVESYEDEEELERELSDWTTSTSTTN